ncbi:hypothetical protein LTS18_002510, partial [Coniosporium uncinatum]
RNTTPSAARELKLDCTRQSTVWLDSLNARQKLCSRRPFTTSPSHPARLRGPPRRPLRPQPTSPSPDEPSTLFDRRLDASETETIFGHSLSSDSANSLLNTIQHRRETGELSDQGILFREADFGSHAEEWTPEVSLKALDWLREQYPIDEEAAAERWAEQEARQLEEELARRGQSLGLYKKDEDVVDVNSERRPEGGRGGEQALQGTEYGRERYGESGLEAIRRENEEKHERELEEQRRMEEEEMEREETGDQTLKLMRQAYAKYSESSISPFEAGYMEAIMARHREFAEKESPSDFERMQYAKLRESLDKLLGSAGQPTLEMTLSEGQT